MRYYVYNGKYCRRSLLAIFIIVIFYKVSTKISRTQNSLSIANSTFLSNICELSNRYNDVKPFFNSVCEKKFLSSSEFTVQPKEQICDRLYSDNTEPNLFSRIHLGFQPFNSRKILLTDIENISNSCPTCHHVQIIDNILYNVPRTTAWDYETRSRSIKTLIKRAMDIFSDIPNLDLFFNVCDHVDLPNGLNDALLNVPIFGIGRSTKTKRGVRADRVILMPCFSLCSWPQARIGPWSKTFESILDASQKIEYEKRIPKLFWRGAEFPKRIWFIDVAKKYPDIMDILVMKWTKSQNEVALAPSNTYKTLEEHCSYKYLLHQEGVTYSARLKYLLLCGSTVVLNVVEGWEEYWYHLLENGKNIILIETNGNETTLESTLHFLQRNDEKLKDIGRKGQQLVQTYLNEHAVTCYWWKLLHEYAKLLGYKPSLHPKAVRIDDSILKSSS